MMKNFPTVREFLKETQGLTPEQVAKQFYGIDNYQPPIIEALQTSTHSDHREHTGEIEQQLINHFLASNKEIVDDILNNKMKIDGGETDIYPEGAERPKLEYLTPDDIKIQKIRQQEIKNKSKTEQFNIINILARDLPMTAIQIPDYIRYKQLSDFYLAKELLKFQDKNWFPNIDFTKSVNKDRLFLSTSCAKDETGDIQANINVQNTDKDTQDILRVCANQGMKPLSIVDCIILAEIIKDGLGDEYINFEGQKADGDEEGHEELRKKVEVIDDYLGLNFAEYSKDQDYIMRDYGIYIDKKNNKQGYLRGLFNSDFSALGGVCSVRLAWDLPSSSSRYGFRPSV